MSGQCRLVTAILGLLLGLVLVLTACYVKYILYPSLMRSTIEAQLDLRQGTEARANWESPPADIYMAFYFFDVLNPTEVSTGSRPRLRELGPYVFKESRVKEGIVQLEGQISYGEAIHYEFDASKTNEMGCNYPISDTETRDCDAYDQVRVINAPLMALNGILPKPLGPLLGALLSQPICLKLPIIEQEACIEIPRTLRMLWRYLNDALNGENCQECRDGVIRETTVTGELFTGHPSASLKALRAALKVYLESEDGLEFVGFLFDLLKSALALSGSDLELEYPDTILNLVPDSFPFLGEKNGSAVDNYFVIDDGSHHIADFNRVLKFNGQSKLNPLLWSKAGATPSAQRSGEFGTCDVIQGTTGTMFAPFVDKEKRLWMFTGELCRSLGLSFSREESVEGLRTLVYRADESVLSASSSENLCYCPDFATCAIANEQNNSWDLSECKKCKDGILHASTCYMGAPVVMSQPHFLNAHPSLMEDVDEGLSADASKHDTFLNVEPNTGVVMKAHKRIQVNFHLTPNEELDVLANVKETVFPFMWADEFAVVREEAVDQLYFAINTVDMWVNTIAFLATVALGLATLVASLFMLRGSRNGYQLDN